jgi:hypothetical protein
MTLLIIHPIYVIGTQHTSALDVCFFNGDNLFNQYAKQTNLFLDTIELFKTYFLSKTSIQERRDNPQLLALTIDYKQHCKNLIHVFFKIITEYRITKIHIYNPYFFDMLITELQTSRQLHKLKQKPYANIITLFVNKYTWPYSYYSQYLSLTHENNLDILIEESTKDSDLFSTININYKPSSTITNKYVDINCNIYPFLKAITGTVCTGVTHDISVSGAWHQIITKFIDDLYNQIHPNQEELNLSVTLNVYLHLNTTQILNLIYIVDNINTYIPLDTVYLNKYQVDFNTIEHILRFLLIKLKLDSPDFLYEYDCSINYFLV